MKVLQNNCKDRLRNAFVSEFKSADSTIILELMKIRMHVSTECFIRYSVVHLRRV